jgi:hypothetical protein
MAFKLYVANHLYHGFLSYSFIIHFCGVHDSEGGVQVYLLFIYPVTALVCNIYTTVFQQLPIKRVRLLNHITQKAELAIKYNCNMNAFFSFDLFMVYIPECKQQLRAMK